MVKHFFGHRKKKQRMTFTKALLNATVNSHISKLLFTVPFLYFSIFLLSRYIPANLVTYQMFWYIKINSLSLLIYFIKLNLMAFEICYNFISFLIPKVVIKFLAKIFKKFLSVTIYLINNS